MFSNLHGIFVSLVGFRTAVTFIGPVLFLTCFLLLLYLFFQTDPTLTEYRSELITDAGRKLDKARMIRFDERTGYFACTDQGRIASHFYIKYDTVEVSRICFVSYEPRYEKTGLGFSDQV